MRSEKVNMLLTIHIFTIRIEGKDFTIYCDTSDVSSD